VIVYAGVDPVTGKDLYLRESTRDEKKVPEIRSRLLAKVDQQRSAATNATLAYTVDAWLSVHEVDETTLGNVANDQAGPGQRADLRAQGPDARAVLRAAA
jgi:hypothetical protein